ncbi:MAG TPA: CbbX protein [Acidimicrobiia bacterium]|nr:CbbX protein [Acidimicrobiia bacterium]
MEAPPGVDIATKWRGSGLDGFIAELDAELVGLEPVKTRVREIASLLLIDRLRTERGITSEPTSLHMSFTGNPGTGKTTVATRMAEILHRLGCIPESKLVTVTRDDLVGEYIGHTAPKTKEVLKRSRGGVLFIDEAYYLHRPENERDYGQEAIEILLQVMEEERDKLVVIVAGYADRMKTFFDSNPGFRSRIAHHIDFPDYTNDELVAIGLKMLEAQSYRLSPDGLVAFTEYLRLRRSQPLFANARSVRNALDRARLRQAGRLVGTSEPVDDDALMTIQASDIRASRVFSSGDDPE